MKEIKLYNRDHANLRFVSEDGENWKLDVDNKHKYVLEYCRCGYDSDQNIEFVDPSGGPFLNVGSVINEEYILEKISMSNPGFTFTLKKIN